jgi:hypothetical protein
MPISALSSLRTYVFGIGNRIEGKKMGCPPEVISGAQRMRIRTLRTGILNPLELIGKRAKLELRIAQVLYNAGKLPKDGVIVIDELELGRFMVVPLGARSPENREGCSGFFGGGDSEEDCAYEVFKINGFSFHKTEYSLDPPFILAK